MNKATLLEIKVPGYIAAALAITLPLLGGCASPDERGEDGEEDVAEVAQADHGNNGLPNDAVKNSFLSSVTSSMTTLSAGTLTASALSASALSTSGLGVQLMKYMVRCAAPTNTCLDVPVTANDTRVPGECVGGTCHLCGTFGVATGWLSGGITQSDEKWVSACALSLVNVDSVSVQVSVRDAVSGKINSVNSSEQNQYPASESAFYGNIFRPKSGNTFEKYVCNAGASDLAPGRLCGVDASGAVSCSMTFTGSCAGYVISAGGAASTSPACSVIDALPNGAVRQCLDSAGTRWDQAITIYDQPVCGNGLCSGNENPGNCSADCNPHSN